MLNFYAKFLPNLSSLLHPLHLLLRDSQRWNWTIDCEKAFQSAKEKLAQAPVLAHYDPDLPLVLSADASAYGVGAVIAHRLPDGSEQPIAYASRTLTNSEVNYAQIEKEALSLIFGVKKFHHYLYGRHFVLITDHKPLLSILGPKRGIPPLAAARMQRWALILSAYTYKIEFRPTTKHGNADGLSRLPLPDSFPVGNSIEPTIFQLGHLPVTAEEVAAATRLDPTLKTLQQHLQKGWPNKIDEPLVPFWRRREGLSLERDCILWGCRVIIPAKLRGKVLEELHDSHPGIVRMKSLARSHVWWPGIDEEIARTVKACSSCQCFKNASPKAPLHPWSWATKPWERIHLDFAGPFMGKMLLVAVDSHSKWPEVKIMSTTTATKTITVLRDLFARYGLPRQVVSDNGPQFVSEEFKDFMRTNGIKHMRSAPYHPASNGAAERMVQTLKQALKSSIQAGRPFELALSSVLLSYRVTPHSTTGVSPSSLFMGRELRTRLDLLVPDTGARVRDKQGAQKDYHDRHTRTRDLYVGQTVWTRNFRDGTPWVQATVTDQVGPLSYLVELPNGDLWRRHIDHLRAGHSRPSEDAEESSNKEVEGDFVMLPSSSSHTEPTSPDARVSEERELNTPEENSDSLTVPNEIVETDEANRSNESMEHRYPKRHRKPPDRY